MKAGIATLALAVCASVSAVAQDKDAQWTPDANMTSARLARYTSVDQTEVKLLSTSIMGGESGRHAIVTFWTWYDDKMPGSLVMWRCFDIFDEDFKQESARCESSAEVD